MVNHFEIFNKMKPGEGASTINTKLGYNSKLRPQLQIFQSAVLTRCKFPATIMANHSEIFNKTKSSEHASTINTRLGYNSNSSTQLQIFHIVTLTSCKFRATMIVNHSEIFNKTKSGWASVNQKQNARIQFKLDTTTAALLQWHTYTLYVSRTLMVNHSDIFNKTKSGWASVNRKQKARIQFMSPLQLQLQISEWVVPALTSTRKLGLMPLTRCSLWLASAVSMRMNLSAMLADGSEAEVMLARRSMRAARRFMIMILE